MNEQDIQKIAQKISEQFKCEVNETVNNDIIPTDVVCSDFEISHVEYNESENLLEFKASGPLQYISYLLYYTRDVDDFLEDTYDSFENEINKQFNGQKELDYSDLYNSVEEHLSADDGIIYKYLNESAELTFYYQLEETNDAIIAECVESFQNGLYIDVYLKTLSGPVLQAGPRMDETVRNILADFGISNSTLTGDKLAEDISNKDLNIGDTLFEGEVFSSIDKAINKNAQIKRVVLEKK